LRDSPVVLPVLRIASRADQEAACALDDLELRLRILEVVAVPFGPLEEGIAFELAAMQPGGVARI
jgi:hypothetical protein